MKTPVGAVTSNRSHVTSSKMSTTGGSSSILTGTGPVRWVEP